MYLYILFMHTCTLFINYVVVVVFFIDNVPLSMHFWVLLLAAKIYIFPETSVHQSLVSLEYELTLASAYASFFFIFLNDFWFNFRVGLRRLVRDIHASITTVLVVYVLLFSSFIGLFDYVLSLLSLFANVRLVVWPESICYAHDRR